ncbi:hypothetical protein EJ110_NYTH21080 [Nymphaea thermarum]|nr:hypothetical protein EJ110_NYTH21080 [Nymphaea thermarum]
MAEADGRRRISLGPPTFWTQANALLRKNFTFQKRNYKTNLGLIVFPVVLCLLLFLIQKVADQVLDKSKYKCGCKCVDTSTDGSCRTVCGIQYSTPDQASSCPIPNPPKWPALMQIPLTENRAVRSDFELSLDLPDSSCKQTQSCPVTVLFTGGNKTLANRMRSFGICWLTEWFIFLTSKFLDGTSTMPLDTQFIEPAFLSESPLYIILPQCPENFSFPISIQLDSTRLMPGSWHYRHA